MINDKTCQHCQYWTGSGDKYGKCLLSHSSLMFSGEKGADLVTAPDFGCNQFAPARPKKSSEELTQDFLSVCKKLPELERELQDVFAKMLDKEE